jgi:hypothetical protein
MIAHEHLSILGNNKASMRVGQLNIEFLGTLDNDQALASTDVVGNLGSKDAVLEEKHLKLLGIVDDNLAESVGHHVASGCVGTETNSGHGLVSLETTTDAIVNTTGLAPAGLHKIRYTMGRRKYLDSLELVALKANKLLRALLHNFNLV